jgi:AraC family transcriptional regulator of adaptative response/methylated-DNA-[protein]-cysteine methyltransferase
MTVLTDRKYSTLPMAIQHRERTTDEHEEEWAQVLARDASADGHFVYAVTSTGIYCRPTCPSRRPARRHVQFYETTEEARGAGFRACLRCRPDQPVASADAPLIRKLSDFLRRNVDRAVTLDELGALSGMNALAVQRKFERALGVTPRRFQMELRASGFRDLLSEPAAPQQAARKITDALYEAGYSASSRLYAESQQKLGMKPVRFRDGGRGETIEFVLSPCPLGFVLVAATAIGTCWVALGDDPEILEAEMRDRFRHATIQTAEADAGSRLGDAVNEVLARLSQKPADAASGLPLDLRATVFQQRVWKALAAIPRGETRSYGQIAAELGQPTAVRAVARACASNPVALLVPCHRVIGANGDLTGYRWGKERKQKLLALERSI